MQVTQHHHSLAVRQIAAVGYHRHSDRPVKYPSRSVPSSWRT